MRFGIIGCGSIAANSFAPSIIRSDMTELVAVCRRDLEGARTFAGNFADCAAYGSHAQLLADEAVEAVVISTPTDTHCEYTLAAAAAGKHVLCEKPMARDRHEARRMIEACREAGVTLAVAYRRRLFPQVVAAKQLVAAGAIGQTVCTRTHYSGYSDLSGWRNQPGIGGSLMEMAVHRIEVLLNLADSEPLEVCGLIDTVYHKDWQVDDTNGLLLRFADGTMGVHSTILTSKPRRDFAQIDGVEGRILIDGLEHDGETIELETSQERKTIAVEPLPAPYFDQPMIEDLVDAVQQDRDPVCDGMTGYRVQAVADAARESSASGARMAVELWS
jgi:UDP-N-acetyl-2-amino-2-deoxyglucuronate dehydrogenase